MPARKTADAEGSVKPAAAAKTNPALPGKEVRKLEDVALEVRRLREEENLDLQQIGQKLEVSYDVLNQLILHSYKSTMNTPVVFEAQENLRLGQEG
jgi:hypothetical protein